MLKNYIWFLIGQTQLHTVCNFHELKTSNASLELSLDRLKTTLRTYKITLNERKMGGFCLLRFLLWKECPKNSRVWLDRIGPAINSRRYLYRFSIIVPVLSLMLCTLHYTNDSIYDKQGIGSNYWLSGNSLTILCILAKRLYTNMTDYKANSF